MSVLVLSTAYTDNPEKWRAFRESADKFKLNVNMLGVGNCNYPDMEAFKLRADILRQATEKYVLLTCAYDTLVCRWNEAEIVRAIDSAPHMIFSVEEKCWPHDGPYERGYDHIGDHPWKFINGGQYMGRREDMIELFEEKTKRWDRGDATRGGSNQEILHQMYAERWRPFSLDLECRFFQSMLGQHTARVFKSSMGQAYNGHTGSSPMILHWNGQGPGIPAGLTEWISR